MNTFRGFIYLLGIGGSLIFAYLIWVLFGGYAQRSLDMLTRRLHASEAGEDIVSIVESGISKTQQSIDLLTWGLVILTVFTIIAIVMNYYLSSKLAEAESQLKDLNDNHNG